MQSQPLEASAARVYDHGRVCTWPLPALKTHPEEHACPDSQARSSW